MTHCLPNFSRRFLSSLNCATAWRATFSAQESHRSNSLDFTVASGTFVPPSGPDHLCKTSSSAWPAISSSFPRPPCGLAGRLILLCEFVRRCPGGLSGLMGDTATSADFVFVPPPQPLAASIPKADKVTKQRLRFMGHESSKMQRVTGHPNWFETVQPESGRCVTRPALLHRSGRI